MPVWTILLAEPDPLQRQLVDMLLAQDGFRIVTAGTGRDALEFLKEHTPNLAILSVELPEVGGDVICRKLKAVKRLSGVPVILTTNPPGKGGISTDLRQVARAVSADLLLQKPLGDKGLRDRVNELLHRWQGKEAAHEHPDATKNTVYIEQALAELEQHADDDTATLDAVTERLYRENEELRNEVAFLKRRLARLESGIGGRRDGDDPPATFIPGAEPSAPAAAPSAAWQASDAAEPADTEPAGAAGGGGQRQAAARTATPRPDTQPAPAAPAVEDRDANTEPTLPDALPADATREQLQHRVAELERRNRALIAALEDAKQEEEPPRGLFRRWRR